ncbi:MAG: DMT family transporter [Pseudomonadota bacterium]
MLVGVMCFSLSSLLIRQAGQYMDSPQITFIRSAIGLTVLIPLFFYIGPKATFATTRFSMHALRAVVGVMGMNCGFYAFATLPVATSTTISFSRTFFLIGLAAWLLGEHIRWRRTLATCFGFCGVLVILRPGMAAMDLSLIIAVMGAFLSACVVVIIKRFQDRGAVILGYFTVLSFFFNMPGAWLVWQPIAVEAFFPVIGIGLLTTLGQVCLIVAYRAGKATVLSPLDYLRLPIVGVLAFFFFGEIPEIYTYLGAMMILASSFYILHREYVVRRERRTRAAALVGENPNQSPLN